jgi:hypothetical protein
VIPSLAASGLLLLVVLSAKWRGRRLRARAAAAHRDLNAETTRMIRQGAADVGRLVGQLNEQTERLVCAHQDRDALQLIAAGHLRRAWRAERALAAIRARDEVAAYAERAEHEAPSLRIVAS